MTKKKLFSAHKSSIIENNVSIGSGSKIWYFCHIRESVSIGKNCQLGQNVFVDKDVTIGDGCKIQNNVSIYTGVTLEDDVFCGPSCVFTNVLTPRAFVDRKSKLSKTLVRKGATIGANATIVCGNEIGKYSLIGAGAVVTTDIKDYAIVVGVPAKQIGWACKCGAKLDITSSNGVCKECKNTYKIVQNELVPKKEI